MAACKCHAARAGPTTPIPWAYRSCSHAIAAHIIGRPTASHRLARIMVTAGSSPALLMAIACLVDAGDEIIMTDPYYACYPNFIRILKARSPPRSHRQRGRVPAGPLQGKAAHEPGKNPAHQLAGKPHGRLPGHGAPEGLGNLGIPIISDEIYHGLVYESEQHTILEFTDNAIVINGFSKAYAMTGWRLGWAVFPPSLIRTAQKIQQNLMICAPSIAQWGGVAALTEAGADVEDMQSDLCRPEKGHARRDVPARVQRGGGAHRRLLCPGEHGRSLHRLPACLPWISWSTRAWVLPRASISGPGLKGISGSPTPTRRKTSWRGCPGWPPI